MSDDGIRVQPGLELPRPRSAAGRTENGRRHGRRPRLSLLVPVLGLAVLAGCGGGDDEPPNPTVPSTTAAPSSTAASGASTTQKTATTETPRPSVTEPAAAGLANGKHPVYLTGVDTGRRTVTVDLVQLLDRNSAEAKTVCPEIAGGDIDGYCIKNVNGQLRTLRVPPTASISVLNGSSLRKVDLAGLAAARRPQKEQSFFEVAVAGGTVTAIKELYRP